MFMPSNRKNELDSLEDAMKKERAGEAAVEKQFLKDLPHLKARLPDVRALGAFKEAFKLDKVDPRYLNIIVIHPERDISITRVFDASNITFLAENRGERKALEKRDHKAEKGDATRHRFAERANVLVVLDEKVPAKERMLKNVEGGGWILCRVGMANTLRGFGKYKFMGTIEQGSAYPAAERGGEREFWEKIEITSDEELKSAPGASGILTYRDAANAVWEAYKTRDDVLDNYKRLLREAREQNPNAEDGEKLTFTRMNEKGEAEVELTLNPILPVKEQEHDDVIVVMKKYENV